MSQEFSPGFSVERFWLEEPISLFRNTSLVPQCGMTTGARLNALTRLILIITLILYLSKFGRWWLFLLLGLLLIIVLYYLDQQSQTNLAVVENYVCYSRPSNVHPTKTRQVNPIPGFYPYL